MNSPLDLKVVKKTYSPITLQGGVMGIVIIISPSSFFERSVSENCQLSIELYLTTKLSLHTVSNYSCFCSDLDDNALREAAAANDVARCEELLKNGARADACDSRRRTALHFAATIRGGVPLVNLLLRHGADPNAQDVAGNTPMHLGK